MNENVIKRNELLARTVIKGLESRNMHGYYAANKEEALKTALSLIPEGSSVTMGGSVTVEEVGLKEAVKNGPYRFIDRDEYADKRDAYLEGYGADVFLSSANAITQDGVMVNIDGNSNRVSFLAYGPKKLVILVSMNKVCPDVDGAVKRARSAAATANAQRFDVGTPCKKTGTCMNCKSPDSICCNILIMRIARDPERTHVILVDETLGF